MADPTGKSEGKGGGWSPMTVLLVAAMVVLVSGKLESIGNLAVQNKMGAAIVGLANGQQEMGTTLDGLATNVQGLGSQMNQVSTGLSGLLNWSVGAQTSLDQLTTGLTDLGGQVRGLSQQQAVTAQDVSSLGRQVNNLSSQIQMQAQAPQPPAAVYVQPAAPSIYVQPGGAAAIPTVLPPPAIYGNGGVQQAGMFDLVGEIQTDLPGLAQLGMQQDIMITGANGEPQVFCVGADGCAALMGGN